MKEIVFRGESEEEIFKMAYTYVKGYMEINNRDEKSMEKEQISLEKERIVNEFLKKNPILVAKTSNYSITEGQEYKIVDAKYNYNRKCIEEVRVDLGNGKRSRILHLSRNFIFI